MISFMLFATASLSAVVLYFATILLEKEVDIEKIQFMLGHKSVNMTRYYTQEANIDVRSLAPTIWQDIDTGKGLMLR